MAGGIRAAPSKSSKEGCRKLRIARVLKRLGFFEKDPLFFWLRRKSKERRSGLGQLKTPLSNPHTTFYSKRMIFESCTFRKRMICNIIFTVRRFRVFFFVVSKGNQRFPQRFRH